MIDRQQFVEELKLREQIRRAIKIIKEKKEAKAKAILAEEAKLRSLIRSLLKEAEEGTGGPTPTLLESGTTRAAAAR